MPLASASTESVSGRCGTWWKTAVDDEVPLLGLSDGNCVVWDTVRKSKLLALILHGHHSTGFNGHEDGRPIASAPEKCLTSMTALRANCQLQSSLSIPSQECNAPNGSRLEILGTQTTSHSLRDLCLSVSHWESTGERSSDAFPKFGSLP